MTMLENNMNRNRGERRLQGTNARSPICSQPCGRCDRCLGGLHCRALHRLGLSAPMSLCSMRVVLSNAIHTRQLSCVEVMTAYLDHIERLNPKVERHRGARGPRHIDLAGDGARCATRPGESMGPLGIEFPHRGERPSAREGHSVHTGISGS